MTPKEAIEIIWERHMDFEDYFSRFDGCPDGYDFKLDQAILTAVQALEEIQQYQAIGTVEECRTAVEKQKPVKSEDYDENPRYFVCPSCGCTIMADEFSDHKYCLNCGQALLREENFGVIDNGNV